MIVYLLGGLVLGAVIGASVSELRWRRRLAHIPDLPRVAPEPGKDSPQDEVPTNLRVAEAVLNVADRLASQELCRRLGEALTPLEGVRILLPENGADFDPQVHEWVTTRQVTAEQSAGTIAATKVPGMARLRHPSRLRRPGYRAGRVGAANLPGLEERGRHQLRAACLGDRRDGLPRVLGPRQGRQGRRLDRQQGDLAKPGPLRGGHRRELRPRPGHQAQPEQ